MRGTIGMQRAAVIRRLRDEEHMMFKDIAARLGIAVSTAFDYYSDPDGSRADARKALNNGTCADCGAPTKNGGGVDRPERCRPCRAIIERGIENRRMRSESQVGRVLWSDDEILGAIRDCAVDGVANCRAYAEMYARAAPGTMPSLPAITLRFGLWASAVEQAGLKCSRNTSGPYSTRITAEGCLLAVEECMHELGEMPTASMYEAWARASGAPCCALVRHRCGSWMQAIDAVLADQQEQAA